MTVLVAVGVGVVLVAVGVALVDVGFALVAAVVGWCCFGCVCSCWS